MATKKKEEKKENLSIGALWFNKGKKQSYMAGTIEINGETHNIVVFKNNFKQEEKHPDYRIYFRKEKETEEAKEDLPF